MANYSLRTQFSAGGVVFREHQGRLQVALISVGDPPRWQLPKGSIGKAETNEEAALREVREETGLTAELISPIDKIDYWFYGRDQTSTVRVHKHVHFFLLRYLSGDTQDHDHEVNEARWVDIQAAEAMLNFDGERAILAKARQIMTEEFG